MSPALVSEFAFRVRFFAIHCPLLLKFSALSAISPFEVTLLPAVLTSSPVRRAVRLSAAWIAPLFARLSAVISTCLPCQCPELVILPAVIVRSPLVSSEPPLFISAG